MSVALLWLQLRIKKLTWYIISIRQNNEDDRAKTTFGNRVSYSSSSRGLVQTVLHMGSAQFDPTQQGPHMTWEKLTFQVWWGGEGQWACHDVWFSSHTKEKIVSYIGAFPWKLINSKEPFFNTHRAKRIYRIVVHMKIKIK